MNRYLGIDLGGTNIRGAMVDENYEIEAIVQEKTVHGKGAKGLQKQILSMVDKVSAEERPCGIGIGLPGVVGADGCIRYASNLKELEEPLFLQELQSMAGVPVEVLNDCNAAAIAEARTGSGKGYRLVYYLTVSTGIGGGFTIDGRLIEGAFGFAGEAGGIIVERGGSSYRGMSPGAVEGLVGGDALVDRARRISGEAVEHAGMIFKAAEVKKEWALKLADEFCYYMAVVLNNISCVVNPDIFVVGGGCLKSAEYFWERLHTYYRELANEAVADTVIKRSRQKEAVLLGAVMNLEDKWKGAKENA